MIWAEIIMIQDDGTKRKSLIHQKIPQVVVFMPGETPVGFMDSKSKSIKELLEKAVVASVEFQEIQNNMKDEK